MTQKPLVSFVTLILSHYRIPFHTRVREILAENGIDYRLIYSDPLGAAATKGDTVDLPWAVKVPVRRFRVPGGEVYWQSAAAPSRDAELTILSQENKLLFNYWALLRQAFTGAHVAFFGHGKNFQSRNPNGWKEKVKALIAVQVHWWFAYTPSVKKIVEGFGFPAERITINYNTIDVGSLSADLDSVTAEEIAAEKQRLGLQSDNIAIYVGGMYHEKRLPFLIEAAERIRERVPDFQLLLVGSGFHAEIAAIAAQKCDFIHYLGPRFGRDKAVALKLAKAFVMPGLVGLAVMDSFAAGCPLVTTAFGFHSPEIEYLEDGVNGIVVKDADNVAAYADAVAELMLDDALQRRMAEGAMRAVSRYSIENMAQNFCHGVMAALNVEGTAVDPSLAARSLSETAGSKG